MKNFTDLTLTIADLEKFKMTDECKKSILEILKTDVIISLPILELKRIEGLMRRVKEAITYYEVLEKNNNSSLLPVVPLPEIRRLLGCYKELEGNIETLYRMIVGG